MIDGEPWFVAADVCALLDVKNVTQAVGRRLLRPMAQTMEQIVGDLRTEAAQRARCMALGVQLN